MDGINRKDGQTGYSKFILIGIVAIVTIIGFFFAVNFSNKPDALGQDAPQDEPILEVKSDHQYREVTLEVKGMVCPYCAAAITDFFQDVPGVVSSSISFTSPSSTVIYDPEKITKEEIESSAIFSDFYSAKILDDASVDYSVREQKKDPSQYEEGVDLMRQAQEELTLIINQNEEGNTEGALQLVIQFEEKLNQIREIHKGLPKEFQRGFRVKAFATSAVYLDSVKDFKPGDELYGLKKSVEAFRIDLAVNLVIKTKARFLQAQTRLLESEELFDNEDLADAKLLADEYESLLDATLVDLALVNQKGKTQKALLRNIVSPKKEISNILPDNIPVLDKIYQGSIPTHTTEVIGNLLTAAAKPTNIVSFEAEEIPVFLAWVKTTGWYSHKIIAVNEEANTLKVIDGRNNTFDISFEFAETHLREHHHLGGYIDEMGLVPFLRFAMEENLYQHEIQEILPAEKNVTILGDKGTDFETTFKLDFETIMNHIRFDHAWTFQNIIDAGYCEASFANSDVIACNERLAEYEY